MKILALDISSKTGWAIFDNNKLVEYGLIRVELINFNVNNDPNKQPEYPYNLLKAADEMAAHLGNLIDIHNPDEIVIENTVKGRNRHTQRLLEWLHKSMLEQLISHKRTFTYLDPSEWRGILEIRMSKEDKKNNALVNKGKKRGKITKKHLSVRFANTTFGLKLKIKDNDMADAIALGLAFYEKKHIMGVDHGQS